MRVDILEATNQLTLNDLLDYASEYDIFIPLGVSEEDYRDYINRLSDNPESFFQGEIDSANIQEVRV